MLDDPTAWHLWGELAGWAAGATFAWWGGSRLLSELWGARAQIRRARQHFVAVGQAAGLHPGDEPTLLVGRVRGWPVEAYAQQGNWRVRMRVGESAAVRLPVALPAVGNVHVDGAELVADLPFADEHTLPQLLHELAGAAERLYAPAIHPTPTTPLDDAGRRLGLTRDDVLDRWTGETDGRSILVERLPYDAHIRVQVALHVRLPAGMWMGHAHHSAPGDGVPLQPATSAGLPPFAAVAPAETWDAAHELLQQPGLVPAVVAFVASSTGACVQDNTLVAHFPPAAWTSAPTQLFAGVLQHAVAIDAVVAQPWIALGERHGLAATSARRGGLPVLMSTTPDGRWTLQKNDAAGHIVSLQTSFPPGLSIRAGKHAGRVLTHNPVIDAMVSVSMSSIAAPRLQDRLSRLRAETVLPLVLETPGFSLDANGMRISAIQETALSVIDRQLTELQALAQQLPRWDGAPPPPSPTSPT